MLKKFVGPSAFALSRANSSIRAGPFPSLLYRSKTRAFSNNAKVTVPFRSVSILPKRQLSEGLTAAAGLAEHQQEEQVLRHETEEESGTKGEYHRNVGDKAHKSARFKTKASVLKHLSDRLTASETKGIVSS